MSKLILTLRGDVVPIPILLGPELRDARGKAGAAALQINVDDELVAPAMRLLAAEPITAVV